MIVEARNFLVRGRISISQASHLREDCLAIGSFPLVAFLDLCVMDDSTNRNLTDSERRLVRWMLEHGLPEARQFLPQLEQAQGTPWRCGCGCASINFQIEGQQKPPPGLRPIADFLFGPEDNLSGIFVFEQSGVLGGVEVYAITGDAPATLPVPEELRPFSNDRKRLEL